jgi:hypothetical protein
MELSRSVIAEEAEAYEANEPLYAVEAEQIEGLPQAFATGEFGWRDAEWVVQWYYRRRLGGVPNDERRAREAEFGENDYEAVRDALRDAHEAATAETGLKHLTELSGVDLGVGSGFLMFLNPADNIVVSDREWAALQAAGELDARAPEPISTSDYSRYLGVCRRLGDHYDCSMWTLYRALWRLGADE